MNYCGSEISTGNPGRIPYPQEISLSNCESSGKRLTPQQWAFLLGLSLETVVLMATGGCVGTTFNNAVESHKRNLGDCQRRFDMSRDECRIETLSITVDDADKLKKCYVAIYNNDTIKGNMDLEKEGGTVIISTGSTFSEQPDITDYSFLGINSEGNLVFRKGGNMVVFPCAPDESNP